MTKAAARWRQELRRSNAAVPIPSRPERRVCSHCGDGYTGAHVCPVSGGTRCGRCHELCPDNEVENGICIDCYQEENP